MESRTCRNIGAGYPGALEPDLREVARFADPNSDTAVTVLRHQGLQRWQTLGSSASGAAAA